MKNVKKIFAFLLCALPFLSVFAEQLARKEEVIITPTRESIVLHGKTENSCYGLKITPHPSIGNETNSIVIRAFRHSLKQSSTDTITPATDTVTPVWQEVGVERLSNLMDKIILAEFNKYSLYRLQAEKIARDAQGRAVFIPLDTKEIITLEPITDPDKCRIGDADILNLKQKVTIADIVRKNKKLVTIASVIALVGALGLSHLAHKKYKEFENWTWDAGRGWTKNDPNQKKTSTTHTDMKWLKGSRNEN